MQPAPRRIPIYGIDAIRFLAAGVVMLYHFSAKPFLTPEASTLRFVLEEPRDAPSGAVWWGWIGVQVFFVISGAVISFSASRATPRGFFVGRVARLWPAMLLCTALIAALNLGWWGHGLLQEFGLIVRSLLFWPPGPWVTGQIWTLPIEIIFYGLIWLLILAGRESRLEGAAGVLGVVSCGFWLLVWAGLTEPRGLYAWLLCEHGVYFALGMTLMAAGMNGLNRRRLSLILICCIGAWLQVDYAAGIEGAGQFEPLTPYAVWLGACGLIWLSVLARLPIALWIERRGSAARVLRTMGLVTYPLYLVHIQPGGLLLANLLERGVSMWAAIALACVLAILLAALIAVWLEPPLHRVVKRTLDAVLDRAGLRRRAAAT